MKRTRKPYRDRYGRFTKRGQKIRPLQRRDKRGRFLPSKRRVKPKPKRKSLPKKSHLSPKHKQRPEVLRFRPVEFIDDEELGDDEMEVEMSWQDQYEDDFSALDAMDSLDDLSWAEDDEHYHD